MAAPVFIVWNGNQPTTAATVAQPTGTVLNSMFQLKAGVNKLRIVEWGYSFATVPTVAVRVELITSTTGMTMSTALASTDIMTYNDVTGAASQVATGSTANSGFATGALTEAAAAVRVLASQHEFGTQFKQQLPLGRELEVNAGTFLRIRMNSSVSISAIMYVIYEE